ncbi:MAG: recombination regulator RecX [Rhodocyclaceae bacterium]|nr:MAG: recombination regulator RecX [Rhodocyclaceae bacterium]
MSQAELRGRAIRLLARREHTRVELARKLAPHGTAEDIEAVLNSLQDAGLQSDSRFAESYVRSYAERFGAAKLRQTLRTKGVDSGLVETELAATALPDETERARTVWARKFGTAPTDAREWARQARFLQSRGFSTDVIRRILKEQE